MQVFKLVLALLWLIAVAGRIHLKKGNINSESTHLHHHRLEEEAADLIFGNTYDATLSVKEFSAKSIVGTVLRYMNAPKMEVQQISAQLLSVYKKVTSRRIGRRSEAVTKIDKSFEKLVGFSRAGEEVDTIVKWKSNYCGELTVLQNNVKSFMTAKPKSGRGPGFDAIIEAAPYLATMFTKVECVVTYPDVLPVNWKTAIVCDVVEACSSDYGTSGSVKDRIFPPAFGRDSETTRDRLKSVFSEFLQFGSNALKDNLQDQKLTAEDEVRITRFGSYCNFLPLASGFWPPKQEGVLSDRDVDKYVKEWAKECFEKRLALELRNKMIDDGADKWCTALSTVLEQDINIDQDIELQDNLKTIGVARAELQRKGINPTKTDFSSYERFDESRMGNSSTINPTGRPSPKEKREAEEAKNGWKEADAYVRGNYARMPTLDDIIAVNGLLRGVSSNSLRDGTNGKYEYGGSKTISKAYVHGKFVKRELENLLTWLEPIFSQIDEHSAVATCVPTAIKMYIRLVSIHPFGDANGRTCKLLGDWVLLKCGLPPNIWKGNFALFGAQVYLGEGNPMAQMRGAISNAAATLLTSLEEHSKATVTAGGRVTSVEE